MGEPGDIANVCSRRTRTFTRSYAELNPGADPNDVLDAKTFIYDIAHSINGKYGDSLPCCSTVLQVWKDLGARWNWRFKVKLNSSTFTTVSNVSYQKDVLSTNVRRWANRFSSSRAR